MSSSLHSRTRSASPHSTNERVDCLLACLHPLVEAGAEPEDVDAPDPLGDIANDCRIIGYEGEVTAVVHSNGVEWHHAAHVVFWLDPESDDESLHYWAIGAVDTWVSGTEATSRCTYSSPAVRHVIPTDEEEEIDHPMTDGYMTLALWSDPPSMTGGGMAFIDLTITTRCPASGGGVVTTTFEYLPPWACFAVLDPVPIGDDLSITSGSYTAPDATDTSWSKWSYHLRRTKYD